jgi:hypothetical protein
MHHVPVQSLEKKALRVEKGSTVPFRDDTTVASRHWGEWLVETVFWNVRRVVADKRGAEDLGYGGGRRSCGPPWGLQEAVVRS